MGLAKPLTDGWFSTICGTKTFMAPEIIYGEQYLGNQVDLFATAVSIFILVTGRPPFYMAIK